jgi:RNA polymerase sigma factor (sigma-70 family)
MGKLTDYKQELTVHWPLINTIAGRRFADDTLAEEAALYVLNRLEEDDCRRLRRYQNRANLSTYIASLCIRLLEDFSRKRFGRVRPPGWVTALGGIWLLLFQLLCLQRLGLTDAVETVLAGKGVGMRKEVEEAAWNILERIIHCGRRQGLEVALDEADEIQLHDRKNAGGGMSDPAEQWIDDERRVFFQLLFYEGAEDEKLTASAQQLLHAFGKRNLQLDAEERLLLKLCFQDGLTVTRAGKMLGLNSNQAHGKLRRLLARLRENFDQAGISDELRLLLCK